MATKTDTDTELMTVDAVRARWPVLSEPFKDALVRAERMDCLLECEVKRTFAGSFLMNMRLKHP